MDKATLKSIRRNMDRSAQRAPGERKQANRAIAARFAAGPSGGSGRGSL